MSHSIFDVDKRSFFGEVGFVSVSATSQFQNECALFSMNFDSLPEDCFVDKKFGVRKRSFSVAHIKNRTDIEWEAPDHFVQSKSVNVLYGGIERRFEAISAKARESTVLRQLVVDAFEMACVRGHLDAPVVGVHMIRTLASVERPVFPAPEGIHQDGFKCISVHLVKKKNICRGGGANYLYIEENGQEVVREIMLNDVGDSLFIDDLVFRHDVSPFWPLVESDVATRDVVVLTHGPSVK
jgi:hypothetical protein